MYLRCTVFCEWKLLGLSCILLSWLLNYIQYAIKLDVFWDMMQVFEISKWRKASKYSGTIFSLWFATQNITEMCLKNSYIIWSMRSWTLWGYIQSGLISIMNTLYANQPLHSVLLYVDSLKPSDPIYWLILMNIASGNVLLPSYLKQC